MKPKPKKNLRLLALVLCCGLLFTACRPSTALSREVSSQEDLNLVNDANYFGSEEQLEERTEIEYLTGQEVDEDSHNTEQELTAGQAKEDESQEDTADLTPEVSYNADENDSIYGAAQVNTENTNEADSSTVSDSQADDTANDASSAAGGSTNDNVNASGGGQGDGSTLNEEQENGSVQDNNVPVDPTEEKNESENDGGDNNENKKDEIIDPNGEIKTVISGEGKVAAVGEAATLVCMLAGVDRLCATSESQTSDDNPLLQQAFPIDEEECAVLWSGDGSSSALDDEDFATLLEIGPDAVFYLSGTNTFTSDQIDQLDEAGIGHYPLDFTTQDGIETAVEVVGNALGEQDRAEEYFDWCSDLESDLSGLSAVDTIFIYDWDDTAVTTCYGWLPSGETHTEDEIIYQDTDGAAVIRVGTNWDRSFLEYVENYANITDRAKKPISERTVTGKYTYNWLSPLQYSWVDESDCTPDGGLCLISTLFMDVQCKTTLQGSYDLLMCFSGNYEGAYKLIYGLGLDDFPGIIVRNQDTYNALKASALWNQDFFESSGSTTSGAYYYNYTYGASYDGETKQSKISSDIRSWDYGIYVNPVGGIGSWMDGSAESVLESVWAAAVLSDYNETAMYNAIRSFYATFYGLNLSDSQIDQYVLAGE